MSGNNVIRILCLLLVGFVCCGVSAETPQVLVKGYDLQLLAEQPEIVTPVSVALDAKERLFVVENNTHQRRGDYQGHPHDRIRIMEFSNGKLVKNTIFHDGLKDTMSIRFHQDGTLYVATRSHILRLEDQNQDDVADNVKTIVTMKTDGTYPHNGLSGLCFDFKFGNEPTLYFGMGENLGFTYSLVAADGSKVDGGGEGGSIFAIHPDGSNVKRFATGFWNPFGNCFDSKGRLFSIDNDPDASPPCRLIHVFETGDYGYQFRYGRSGRHPLQTWTGTLPGTLGMAAGTGEAPCEIVPHAGRLWVTSWGDHRIERYRIVPNGAGCVAERQLVVRGSKNFRPVGLAVAASGTIYFSDWVDRSYPVHGKGKIWRLVPNGQLEKTTGFPVLSALEKKARSSEVKTAALLDDDDPYLRQVGIHRIAQSNQAKWSDMKSARQKVGFLRGTHWRNPEKASQSIERALNDPNTDVQLTALRIIADDNLKVFQPRVINMLENPGSDARLLNVIASVALWLNEGSGSKDRKVIDRFLTDVIFDGKKDQATRLAAMQLLPDGHGSFQDEPFQKLLNSQSTNLARTAVRILAMQQGGSQQETLRSIAIDKNRDDQLRADAIAGLVAEPTNRKLCHELQSSASAAIKTEAERNLKHFGTKEGGQPDSKTTPKPTDVDAWLKQINQQESNVDAGRRIFFRSSGSQCSKCHRHSGRGSQIGPDLTQVHRRATKRWLLESILQPSKEMSPLYTPVTVIKDDGTSFSGLEIEGPGDQGAERFLLADGTEINVDTARIESRHHQAISIMPSGFDQQLSVDEIADLIAFLMRAE